MLNANAEMISDALSSYAEHHTASWILTCTDHEFEQVCRIAEWLMTSSSGCTGAVMLTARAVSLAAVSVAEGTPRPLARQQRRRITAIPVPDVGRAVPGRTVRVTGGGVLDPFRPSARDELRWTVLSAPRAARAS